MPEHFFFYLGLSLLFVHELDAIRCREWRIFPGLSLLSDKWGHRLFVWAHIPIFFFVLSRLGSGENPESFIYGFNLFFLIHLLLHVAYLKHRNNEFKDWISWSVLIGIALCGMLDLLR